MAFQETRRGELDPPPIASSEPNSVEVLRVWACPGKPQQLTLRTTWQDPGAWGLVLADLARHAALAYQQEGRDREVAFERIIAALNAELDAPTDNPETL